ncbi:MAG TPA: SpvB/TcaC N-terminal domain-containing protein, partial [Acidiferrobacterales bacterium]|nr:SpvB/TcaC N-terminal domain-containing protein [Acidiferrobacterales bacterium]
MSAYSIPRRFGWTKPVIYSAFLVLGLLPLSAFAVTAPVGATPGSFAVNQNGGATYTIPISVPPGTAGMVPKLVLSYDKQVQNDLLGVGWSVSGLSVIQRCGATIALDGMKGGVNYDNNDRFCLDGQRLVAINNGVYGANGTEYRTEKETFIKIISYRDNTTFTGSGPQYFRVTTKSGTVMEYGVTTDSRIEAQDKPTVRVWALNKVQDTKGNYLTISYFKDTGSTGTGEYRPIRIDYTGNTNASPTLSPYNSVQFVYGPRTDITPRYEGGSVIKTTQRLTNIKTCTGVTSTQLCTDLGVSLVRDYQLTYDNNGAVGGSRLIGVTECGSDGVCLPKTSISWTGGTDVWQSVPDLNSLSPGQGYTDGNVYPIITGDWNGDGKT